MTKFNAIAPKAAALVRMLTSTTEGEVLNAVRLLLQLLASAGLDIHALAERIEKGGDNNTKASLNAAEMQRIYDKAYQKGFADGSEHGRKSADLCRPLDRHIQRRRRLRGERLFVARSRAALRGQQAPVPRPRLRIRREHRRTARMPQHAFASAGEVAQGSVRAQV